METPAERQSHTATLSHSTLENYTQKNLTTEGTALGPLAANQVHKMVKFASGRGTGVSLYYYLRGRFGWDGWDQRGWPLFRPFRADSFGHPSFPGRCPGLLHYAPVGAQQRNAIRSPR